MNKTKNLILPSSQGFQNMIPFHLSYVSLKCHVAHVWWVLQPCDQNEFNFFQNLSVDPIPLCIPLESWELSCILLFLLCKKRKKNYVSKEKMRNWRTIPCNLYARKMFFSLSLPFWIFATSASVHISISKEIRGFSGVGPSVGWCVPLVDHSINCFTVPRKYILSLVGSSDGQTRLVK